MFCSDEESVKQLKTDQIAAWIAAEWLPPRAEQNLAIVWEQTACVNAIVLGKLDREMDFAGYRFIDRIPVDCPAVNKIESRDHEGKTGEQLGAFLFQFAAQTGEAGAEVLVIATHYREEHYYTTALAAVPETFRDAWTAFSNECNRLAYHHEPDNSVFIVGGRHDSFVPTVDWDEIVLPDGLKADIMNDVALFFTKGAAVYTRLNLKPFRKLLLAGVPGTGKTMLCNALAKWALKQNILVIYVSSARKSPNDEFGSTFTKVQYALDIAASSRYPTLIILEELDAYLHDEEKALILNVLDGSESAINPHGTLLISTTNYPEAIDERVLKRPGRLDRIFIVPETRTQENAGEMLRHYLGVMWDEAHTALVPQLVGYPGAFIREVAIYALTQVAYDDLTELPYDLLEASFERLKAQIAARDDFMKGRENGAAEKSADTSVSNGHLVTA